MKIHNFKLQNKPFTSIKNGLKTIEMRLYDEKRQLVEKGDLIIFKNIENEETLTTRVVSLYKFSNFKDLYQNFDKTKLGYNSQEEAKPEDMEKYYKREEMQKYGVVGIEVKIIWGFMEELLNVDLYTDGACRNNPGPGGWGYLLMCKGKEKYDSGYKEYTTNNEMEITAVIEGVKAIKKSCNLTIYTDSTYLADAFLKSWIVNWKKNGYRNAQKKEIANKELWLTLLSLLENHNYKWVKVKGHSTNVHNNFCDKLATDQIKLNYKN